jgi:hypothetical protein
MRIVDKTEAIKELGLMEHQVYFEQPIAIKPNSVMDHAGFYHQICQGLQRYVVSL